MTLSKRQKRVLAQTARAAWEALPPDQRRQAHHDAATDDHPLPSENQAFTHWRRAQQRAATGEPSLTKMRQEDYLVVKLHFEMLARTRGGTVNDVAPSREAARTLGKLASDGQRRARWKLDRALEERDLTPGYAESICQRQFRCGLNDASEKQLWSLFYTVRNRRKPAKAAPSAANQPF